ncbi:MAG: GtrA family protein [Clostridium lundense]|nr:GtrA family protein [Clostridium lundense]
MKSIMQELITNKSARNQFIKYLFVGGFTAFFEILLYAFLRKVVYLNLTLSNIIATVIATAINFWINRGWSFKSASNLSKSLILYLILFFLNASFSTLAINVMVKLKILDIAAKFITMCMITVWNFVIYRKLIFK